MTIGLGGLAGLLTSIWSQIRPPVAIEGDAWLCTSGHPLMIWSDAPWPSGPKHVDVTLRFWIQRGTKPATILDLDSATVNGAKLSQGGTFDQFHELTLDPSGKSETAYFTLHPPEGEDLRASAGDVLDLRFRLNWGARLIAPKIRAVLKATAPDSAR